MSYKTIPEFLNYDLIKLNKLYDDVMKKFDYKIVVLDDDPTGIQKVNNVYVYTNWDVESIEDGFRSKRKMFFILTNSRSFTVEKTKKVHTELAQKIEKVSSKLKQGYIIISRGDSTLRGHYPLETEVLNQTIGNKYDGEVIIPFFKEGGRYTIENIHYVKIKDKLVPVSETEFAKDSTFGYTKSHLGEYVEEKSRGEFKKEDIIYISLNSLRDMDIKSISKQLLNAKNFNKVIVNAISDDDLKVFLIALNKVLELGKKFLFRTAASFTKIAGNINDKELLTRDEMLTNERDNGGLIVVGSYVQKTTEQLNELLKLDGIKPIEFNSDLVLDKNIFDEEIRRCIYKIDENIKKGITCVIYTKRSPLKVNNFNPKDMLSLSIKISDGLTKIIESLKITPKYIIAKGGITSSEIGAKALGVKKALVLGQALPGVPVWQTDLGSKYPKIPYIIFPGNVGGTKDLYNMVKMLES